MTLSDTYCKVQNFISVPFRVDKGVRQGDPVSSVLFNLVLDRAIKAISTNRGGCMYNRMEQHMAFADDVPRQKSTNLNNSFY